MSPTAPWLMEWPATEAAERVLVCCHHAGGGASQFHRWQERLGPRTTVLALQLPGRQNRWGEPPLLAMDEIVAEACEALLPRLDLPFSLFGHSMGGLVAYELARRLGTGHARWPQRLIVSASRPPDRRQVDLDLRRYDDAQVVRRFVDDGTLPPWVVDDTEVQTLLLPPLRGDYAVCHDYRHRPGPPLPCAITVCGGADDDGVGPADLEGWRAYVSAPYERRMFPGGHLFHLDPGSGLLPYLSGLLAADPVGEEPREVVG
ncbi:thioesterase II family protein [Streptomyces polyrhachis]|uniref:Thioesterase II family protein n=1 Tax=Streptomyces polyrhachis TaxID=1282885 RepID=A0ABW2GFW7_9ACTN